MATFFFHLRDGRDHTLDPEPVELPDIAAAARRALREARVILGNDLQESGRIKLDYRIDIEDETGSVIYTLPFTEAVEIVRPEDGAAAG